MRAWLAISIFAAASLAAIALRLLIGPEGLAWPGPGDVLMLRSMRLASGVVVGAALAIAGVLLQSLLRNPLASPDLMGLSAGASFAVILAAAIAAHAGGGLASWGGHGGPALAGSLGALGIVYAVSQRRGLIDPISMVLMGVIVGLLFGAASKIVETTLPDRGRSVQPWLLGGLSADVPLARVVAVAALTAIIAGAAAWAGPAMDAAALGEDEARASGVPIGRLRLFQFVGAGVLTAGSVMLAGPLGFVGLVCPHAARIAGGARHRTLIVAAGLAGIALVVGADVLVRAIPVGGGRLPIGALTSLVGGPVFIALLWSSRGRIG